MKNIILFFGLIFLWTSLVAAPATTFYVDYQAGNDANLGRTPDQAFKTIDKARAAIRPLLSDMKGDVEVRLKGGLHSLAKSVTFTSEDSGRNGYQVIYKNYEGETPVVSGGVVLAQWQLHDPARNIWKHAMPGSRPLRQVYSSGKIMTLARYPNRQAGDPYGPFLKTLDSPKNSNGYRVEAEDIPRLKSYEGVELVVQPHWYHNHLLVADIVRERDDAIIKFASPHIASAFQKERTFYVGNSYHFENSYELLDTPGEWYYDAKGKTLYYMLPPGGSMTGSDIVAGNLEVLFEIKGEDGDPVHDLRFENITFSHTDWMPLKKGMLVATQAVQPLPLNTAVGYSEKVAPPGALRARYGTRLAVFGCTFTALGANGVQFFMGVKDSKITGCRFEQIAGNAINLDAYVKVDQSDGERTEKITISENRLSGFGAVYTNGVGILAGFVKDVLIEHNEIWNGPYIGIQVGNQAGGRPDVGMRNNLIKHNLIHRVMMLHDDGGAIYTLGPQPGSRIEKNYIHDVVRRKWAMGKPLAGIYLDNDTRLYTVADNVLIKVGTPLYLQYNKGTKDNVLEKNDNVENAEIMQQAGPQKNKP